MRIYTCLYTQSPRKTLLSSHSWKCPNEGPESLFFSLLLYFFHCSSHNHEQLRLESFIVVWSVSSRKIYKIYRVTSPLNALLLLPCRGQRSWGQGSGQPLKVKAATSYHYNKDLRSVKSCNKKEKHHELVEKLNSIFNFESIKLPGYLGAWYIFMIKYNTIQFSLQYFWKRNVGSV